MRPLLTTLSTIGLVAAIISVAFMPFVAYNVAAATDYTFGSENVTKGSSVDPSNKNAEDAAYNQLIEGDQYTDTNFSGSSENVDKGTAGGGSFPTALDTDDATRRSYTEEDTGGAPPAGYEAFLYPDGDVQAEWDTVYPSGDHYAQVDETTEGGDDGTTYLETGTLNDEDRFSLEDLGDPGSGYTLDVRVFAVHYKGASQPCDFTVGIRIGSTNYAGYSVNPTNGAYTNQSSTSWTDNPATSSEWTYAEIDSLVVYITTSDASPDVRCTQVGVHVYVNYSVESNYELDAQITYSSVTSTAQTTGYKVFCQGYRSGSENFGVYAWDYVAEDWNLKDTIEDGSDTDYDFSLTADERDGAANEVKIRILGGTESSDTTQDVVYLDVLKVSRIEKGYALDVDITSSSAPEHGNITLRIKGYTSAEAFQVDVWNYSESAYDTNVHQITDLGNAWQTTIDLNDTAHRSGTSVKVRFVDTTAEASDTTKDTLYLDVVWVTHYYTDPEVSDYRTGNVEIEQGQDVVVWCTYSDYDDQAPSYVRVHTNATYYSMGANDSDTDYFDGKLYGYTITGLTEGWYYYYFAVKDAESGEITTETTTYTITVTAAANTPANFLTSGITQWQNGTNYQYNAQVEDVDSDPITWDLEGNGTAFLTETPNGYFCLISGTVPSMGWWYVNISADDDGDSVDVTWQNYTLTALNDAPYFTTSPVTEAVVNETYIYDFEAADNNSDALEFDMSSSPSETKLWLSYNTSSGQLEGLPTTNGSFDVNLSCTDTVGATTWQNFTIVVDLNDADTVSVLKFIIALVFCFGFMAVGFKEKALMILAGFCWMICGVAVFLDYGPEFMVMGVGLGMVLLLKGVYDAQQ